jgi:hypothetical protein
MPRGHGRIPWDGSVPISNVPTTACSDCSLTFRASFSFCGVRGVTVPNIAVHLVTIGSGQKPEPGFLSRNIKLVAPLYSGDYCHLMQDYLPTTRVYAFNRRLNGARGNVVVKALRCKPEGCEFETQWGKLIFFNLPNPSGRTRPWGWFTQPLAEMSTRSRKIMFLGSRARPVRRTDNLSTTCEPIVQTMWDP